MGCAADVTRAAEERETLSAILENEISDLSMEISHTDSLDFRTLLKHKKAVLTKVRPICQGLSTTVHIMSDTARGPFRENL
jgi:hypothetical protein